MSSRGQFISFEGPDGTGKSTAAQGVVSMLKERGEDVILVREPGGTPIAERCRSILLTKEQDEALAFEQRLTKLASEPELISIASHLLSDSVISKSPDDFSDKLTSYLRKSDTPNGELELLLFSIARYDLITSVVNPSLGAGKTVMADRFTLSTFVYQGIGRGVGDDKIAELTQKATQGTTPDLTLLFDVSEEVAMSRIGQRDVPDIFETPEMWRVAREAYLSFAMQDPQKIIVVDASGPVESVKDHALSVILNKLHPQVSNLRGRTKTP